MVIYTDIRWHYRVPFDSKTSKKMASNREEVKEGRLDLFCWTGLNNVVLTSKIFVMVKVDLRSEGALFW